MNFLEAVKAMKEGKKVRREAWHRSLYCVLGVDIKVMYGVELYSSQLNCYDCEATDWQIVEEKKTLSDKQHNCYYDEPDVKEAIKEYLKGPAHDDDGMSRAKQIFGERLI